MKKSEIIGLLIALTIVIVTFMSNVFVRSIPAVFSPTIARASDQVDQSKKDEDVFKPLMVWTSKKAYMRYDLVQIYANFRNYDKTVISRGSLTARFYFHNKLMKTITDMDKIELKFNPASGVWEGLWPVPWNPPLGEYQLLVVAKPDSPSPVLKETCDFRINGREPPPVDDGFTIMALETFYNLFSKQMEGPDGSLGDWRNVIAWAKYMGADAIFSLAGMTDGYLRYGTNRQPLMFRDDCVRIVKKLSAEAHRNKIRFGAWVMSYMMQSKNFEQMGYSPSIGYVPEYNSLFKSFHISMGDKKRLDDLVALVKDLDAVPTIDFIGIDYIRTGQSDGFEMVNEIVKDMSIDLPDNWNNMGERERIIWFGRKIMVDKDPAIIEKWRWWRAHRSALIVQEIIERSGTKKPIWLFSLGWEHGKQHGQDPLMFNDAGITYDAAMLYEANSIQFRQVLVDWKAYLRAKQVNVLCGNSVDVNLLDSDVLTPPEEIVRRTIVGSQQLLFGGLSDGIFWHDLSRALWGHKGEYSTKEWCITGGTTFSRYREEKGLVPVSIKMETPQAVSLGIPFKATVKLENISLDNIKDLRINIESVEGIRTEDKVVSVPELSPGEIFEYTFDVTAIAVQDKIRWNLMVPVKVSYDGDKKSFDFSMVRVRRPVTTQNNSLSSSM